MKDVNELEKFKEWVQSQGGLGNVPEKALIATMYVLGFYEQEKSDELP